MRILVFSPYYPPHVGGLESHSQEFNKYLSQEGAEITVFTPKLPASAAPHENPYKDVTIIRFPAWEPIGNYPFPLFWRKEFWRCWQEISREKHDLILSRTRFFFTSLMAWHFAKRHTLPWVHVEHGSDYAQFSSQLKYILGKWYDHLAGRFVLKHSTKNIANSIASENFVCTLSRRKDTEIIYRGIEQQLIQEVPADVTYREKFAGKIIIGFIGRLTEGKGIQDLVSALAALKAQSWVCLIIGEGPERSLLLKQIREAGLSESILLLGNKSFAETMALLKAFDIFINPSYTEGIPTSVIEAALTKKAIIATDVGGTREIISGQGDGFLVPPRNPGLLSEKIELLIDDPGLRLRCGEKAFQNTEKKFLWSEAAQKYLALFHKILY